jgi:hypothetical protein
VGGYCSSDSSYLLVALVLDQLLKTIAIPPG